VRRGRIPASRAEELKQLGELHGVRRVQVDRWHQIPSWFRAGEAGFEVGDALVEEPVVVAGVGEAFLKAAVAGGPAPAGRGSQ
jgi:hypothetical protein